MSNARSSNVSWQQGRVARSRRSELFGQQGATLWLTGLSASGKSTLAFLLEQQLVENRYKAYVLDGDNMRHGLNSNLGFSAVDREENIRRVGEVARLFADAGLIVIASFISPFRKDRALVRAMHETSGLTFIEIHVDTPLAVCEQRDPKQLYAKARRGEISDFTGISSPYEVPENPELVIGTMDSPQASVDLLLACLRERGLIRR
jgi:adenylylsulfate kinase